MILSYDLPDDMNRNDKSGNNSPKSTKQLSTSSSTSKECISNNIFIHDTKYSKTFGKHKAQNDEIFYEKFEDLRLGETNKKTLLPEILSSASNSDISVKEDNFINTDVLKMLNSSQKNTESVSESSLNVSAMIEEDMKKDKKLALEESSKKTPLTRKSEELLIDNFQKLNMYKDDEKNISLDSSIISELSQGSKNFIAKDLLFRDCFENTKNPSNPENNENVIRNFFFQEKTSSPLGRYLESPINRDEKNKNSPNLITPVSNHFAEEFPYYSIESGSQSQQNKISTAKPGNSTQSNLYINNFHTQNIFHAGLNTDQNEGNVLKTNNIFKEELHYSGTYPNNNTNSNIGNNNLYHRFNSGNNFNVGIGVEKYENLDHPQLFSNNSTKMSYHSLNNEQSNIISKGKNHTKQKHNQHQHQQDNHDYQNKPKNNKGGKNKKGGQSNYHNNNNYFNNEDQYPTETRAKSNTHIGDSSHNPHSKNFKQLNYIEMNEDEILNNLFFIAKEQAGCRFLQKKIEDNPSFAEEVLFPKIINENILDLMIDGFGNYLVQKIIENVSDQSLEQVIHVIYPKFLSLGLNAHGTRVIQKVIESIRTDKNLNLFLPIFHQHMMDLMKDVNGNHVIIKFVQTFNYPISGELYNEIIDHIVEIATHKHACCAFQKCIDAANEHQRGQIMEKLVANTSLLMSDPYGNYVLQYIIMLNHYPTNYNIACIFKNNIGYLSKQKFSSNVIEKCFDHCDDNTKFMIVKEVANPKIIAELLLDMYGNYVLQKALACAQEPYYTILINSIGPHLERLKTVSFGQKLYSKLLLAYPELNSFLVNSSGNKATKPKKNNKNQNKSQKVKNSANNNGIGLMGSNMIPNMNTNMGGMNNYGVGMNFMNMNQNHYIGPLNMQNMNSNMIRNQHNFNTQNQNQNNFQFMNQRNNLNNYTRKF